MKKALLSSILVATVALTAAAEEKIVIDGSTTVGPIAKAFAEYFMAANPNVNITVSESGSGNGAKSLVNNVCDVAAMSRPMKDKEFKAAAEKGIQPVAHVVALDGLPILVHPKNPVAELSLEQIRKIYTGEITNWKQVGGPDMGIVVITRDTNSGTYETFEKLVMNKQKITEKAEYVGSNGAIRQRVQTTPSAIGYAGLGFVDKTVKALKVDGIYPSAATVRTGEYPIARPLFMYTSSYPKLGSSVYQFVTLHLSEDGQEMVEEIGFTSVTSY
jgi:phosphate transport system substrate-binding protein